MSFIKEKIKVISNYISWINKDWEDKSLILTSKILMSSDTGEIETIKTYLTKSLGYFLSGEMME